MAVRETVGPGALRRDRRVHAAHRHVEVAPAGPAAACGAHRRRAGRRTWWRWSDAESRKQSHRRSTATGPHCCRRPYESRSSSDPANAANPRLSPRSPSARAPAPHGSAAAGGGPRGCPAGARTPLHLDHRARRGDQVDRDVVGGHEQVLAQDLDRVHGGGDDRVAVHLARLAQQPVLEVRVAAALADPRALEVHRHRAGEHEVELRAPPRGRSRGRGAARP